SQRAREARAAYWYLVPTFAGFLLFTAGPLIASIALSFTRYDVVTSPVFTGLANYRELIGDERLLRAFRNTAVFVVASTLIELVLALLLAVGVQRRMPTALRYFLRTAFFLPVITSAAAISIAFAYLFSKDFGVINYYLSQLGLERVPWLTSTRWSLITVILAAVWQRLGFTFILFVAGLQNIPRDLYEAAALDGATGWTRLRTITVPLLSPTILFAAVIGVIGSLQVFDQPYIMTSGGPGDSSRTVVMMIQESAFDGLRFGYGSAIAVVLFLVIMLFTLLQFWLSRRWVHYR
ncbi:MAG: sugar ABC transporter permease, partial [Chloroflexota bacterium]|nr:sugar ABC transporter permease [Chloroflexota bacterium]